MATALYDRASKLLTDLAYHHMTADHANGVEDVAQEIFIEIVTKCHQYDPSLASAETWIYNLARGVAKRMNQRKASRAPAYPDTSSTQAAEEQRRENARQWGRGEVFEEVRASFAKWVPCVLSDRLNLELIEMHLKHRFRLTNYSIAATTEILQKHGFDITDYGKPRDVTLVLLLMYRWGIADFSPGSIDELANHLMDDKSPNLITEVLTRALGPYGAAMAITLFGGYDIQLPLPQTVLRAKPSAADRAEQSRRRSKAVRAALDPQDS